MNSPEAEVANQLTSAFKLAIPALEVLFEDIRASTLSKQLAGILADGLDALMEEGFTRPEAIELLKSIKLSK